MQNQLGFLGSQNMLGPMNPMLHMPGSMQLPNQLQLPGPVQMPSSLHAQQLQQQVLMHVQQAMPIGPQLSAPITAQQQMLAAHRAQMDPSSNLCFNMYGGMYRGQ